MVHTLAEVPLYPTILVVTFLANLAVTFLVAPQSVARSVAVGIVVAVALTVATSSAARDRHRGGAIAAGLIVVAVSSITPWLTLALGIAVVIALTAFEHSRGPVPWDRVTVAGNALSLVLLALLIVKAVTGDAAVQMARDLGIGAPTAAASSSVAPTDPDIYLVLLDGHPRGDVLEGLGHDPSGFLDGLRDRGFSVAPRSRSSYGYTAGTLTSMFQMRHLDETPELAEQVAGKSTGNVVMRNLIGSGAALTEFRRRGYEIVTAPSQFEDVTIRTADRILESGTLNEYEATVIRSIGLPILLDLFAPTFLSGNVADRVTFNLGTIISLAREAPTEDAPPRLMFIHVPSPHAPIIFNADGTIAPGRADRPFSFDAPRGMDDLRRRYLDNIQVLDARVLATLDELDAVPQVRPRVVIVFADHGIDVFASSAAEGHRQHVATLFASRISDGSDPYGPAPVTVNLFPILLNHLFDAGVPLRHAGIRDSGADDPWDWVELGPEP